jgi:hypothetical protein
MSRLATLISRLGRSTNLAVSFLVGLVDDGTGDVPEVGEPSPLRVDPTTGGLVVSMTNAASSLGAYTRYPALGTASLALSSGVVLVSASIRRIRRFNFYYTGATASGRYLQAHNSATTAGISNATFVMGWPVNTGAASLEWDSPIDVPLTAGLVFAISSTPVVYTAATSKTGNAAVWGA